MVNHHQEENPSTPPAADLSHDDSNKPSFIDFLLFVARHKKLLLAFPLAGGIVAGIVAFLLPTWYAGTAKILPPQQSHSASLSILGQLGGLAAGGVLPSLGLRNPADVYVAMLKSRTVADRLIERFHLLKVYDEELYFFARSELSRNTSITAGRDGVIKIEVEDKDPQRAADLANAYVDQLRLLTGELALSEASQRRLFFEVQLKKAKSDLASAEGELRKFAEEKGLISPEGQITLSVSAAAALRAQITAKEVELTARRSFATENNPELKRTQEELNGLRLEMAKLERNASAGKGDALVPFGKAPGVGLEYIRRFRDVKYFETLFEILAKQYEIARIDESKDAPVIQILESAVKPERRSSPKRSLVAIAGFGVATVVAFASAIVYEAYGRMSLDPKRQPQLRELRRLLSLRNRRMSR